jgi:hypothetical protein
MDSVRRAVNERADIASGYLRGGTRSGPAPGLSSATESGYLLVALSTGGLAAVLATCGANGTTTSAPEADIDG